MKERDWQGTLLYMVAVQNGCLMALCINDKITLSGLELFIIIVIINCAMATSSSSSLRSVSNVITAVVLRQLRLYPNGEVKTRFAPKWVLVYSAIDLEVL